MRIFVSYARRDRGAVDALLQDIRRARHDVWVDEELTGGQSWWETILGTIRGADLFVVALSPDWLASKACAAELQYAIACNRTVLSIMVARVSPQMAPPVIADSQIVDYVERTPDAAIGLVTALSTLPAAGPLPQPPPPHPPVPMSYMNTYRERVDQLALPFQQQSLLLSELRAHLADDDDRDSAMELIRRLRNRGDITESIAKEIDGLVATTAAVAAPAPGWYPDPYRRFEQRYWDGTTWTRYASRGGQQFDDVPTAASTPTLTATPAPLAAPATYAVAAPAASTLKWDVGTFVPLLIVSLIPCLGLIGVFVGGANLKKPARRSQAWVLLLIGIASTVLLLANVNIHSGSEAML